MFTDAAAPTTLTTQLLAAAPVVDGGPLAFVALVAAAILLGWSAQLIRRAYRPVAEMLRIVAGAAFAAVLVAGALLFLVVSMLTR